MEQEINNQEQLLTPGKVIRPPGNESIAAALLEKIYGMTAKKIIVLNAYDDRNYHIICEASHRNPHLKAIQSNGYVLKIVNSLDSQKTSIIEAQTDILIFLNQRGIKCPLPVKNVRGSYYSLESFEETTGKYAVRLLEYRPGELLQRAPITEGLLTKVGLFAAELDKTLLSFSHPAYEKHKTMWMLIAVPKLREFVYAVKKKEDRQMVLEVISAFEKVVIGSLDQLEEGIIHGDLNEQNIVVNTEATDVEAVIDFGDSHRTCLIFELAITLCYMMLQTGDFRMGKHVIHGYRSVRQINYVERRLLKTATCARICQSLVMGAYTHLHDPKNEYLLSTQKSGWALLKKLWPLSEKDVLQEWGLLDAE